jgi:hypothetical protein
MPIGIGTTGSAAMITIVVAVTVAVFVGLLEDWYDD